MFIFRFHTWPIKVSCLSIKQYFCENSDHLLKKNFQLCTNIKPITNMS